MTAAKTERLDRLLSRLGYCSRRDARDWVKQGLICIDDARATSAAARVSPMQVSVNGETLDHPEGLTLIYHKPLGSVCSRDDHGRLIYEDFPERWIRRKPPLGSIRRLAKDTSNSVLSKSKSTAAFIKHLPQHFVFSQVDL